LPADLGPDLLRNGSKHAIQEDDRPSDKLRQGHGDRRRVGSLQHERTEAVVDGNEEPERGIFTL
jgi:hypothetical protein